MDTPHSADVIVIGAGPAGLAAAHELMRAGRQVLVFERGDAVATSWRTHREGLRLHTVRRLSGLPGAHIPKRYGRYPTSADLVRYLERYAANGEIDIRTGVAVTAVKKGDPSSTASAWVVVTADGMRHHAETVVMATGYNRIPFIPDLPGLGSYSQPVMHVAHYRGGDHLAGMDVLVVGAGNAAAEAAVEMVASGAGRMRMAVRTTPHIVRRRIWGVPMQAIAIASSLVPMRIADKIAGLLARLTVPDLSDRRLSRPRSDLYTRVARDRSVPVHDTGIVKLLESGRVAPVPAAVGFLPDAVRLADGSLVTPDAVVFATGYRRGLQPLVGGLGLLDEAGDPHARSGTAAAPGFYFVGFTVTATGALRQMAMDARHVARAESRRRVRLS
jgi:putative flavoprotein involved in K+ transport